MLFLSSISCGHEPQMGAFWGWDDMGLGFLGCAQEVSRHTWCHSSPGQSLDPLPLYEIFLLPCSSSPHKAPLRACCNTHPSVACVQDNQVLHWEPKDGYASTFRGFSADEINAATHHIVQLVCPTDIAVEVCIGCEPRDQGPAFAGPRVVAPGNSGAAERGRYLLHSSGIMTTRLGPDLWLSLTVRALGRVHELLNLVSAPQRASGVHGRRRRMTLHGHQRRPEKIVVHFALEHYP